MITIDDTFLETQSPLLFQLDIGFERTLVLACEFVRLMPDTVGEEDTGPPPPPAAAPADNQEEADDAECDSRHCADIKCRQTLTPRHAEDGKDTRKEEKQQGTPQDVNEDVVWVMKLYERVHGGVILRERVAMVKEHSPDVLRALVQASSTPSPVSHDQILVSLFFMGRQSDSEVSAKLHRNHLCITIKEDKQGEIADFVKNRVFSEEQIAREMVRYSQERICGLEKYKSDSQPQTKIDSIARLEKRLKSLEDKINGILGQAKGRPAKRAKLVASASLLLDGTQDSFAAGITGQEAESAQSGSLRYSVDQRGDGDQHMAREERQATGNGE